MVDRAKEYEKIKIPQDIDYADIDSLSTEVREYLDKVRPINLAHAGRIQGVTPAAVAILNVYLRKKYHAKPSAK
jgi:tRNA uridine 5-carboxymethylaminomethyl modification enzyme